MLYFFISNPLNISAKAWHIGNPCCHTKRIFLPLCWSNVLPRYSPCFVHGSPHSPITPLAGNVVLCRVCSSSDLATWCVVSPTCRRHVASHVGNTATFHVSLGTQPTRHIADMSAIVCNSAIVFWAQTYWDAEKKDHKSGGRTITWHSFGIVCLQHPPNWNSSHI